MNAKAETTASKLDPFKWIVAIAIVGGGVYVNAMYAAEPFLYRLIAGLALGAVVAVILMQTAQGQSTWKLAKEANVEIRKVVWPNRTETTQTTLIVVVVVLLVALMLWGLDSGVSWIVQGVIG
mgnify:FL=1